MAATTTGRRSRTAACALALVVLLAGAVSVAAAADTTAIGVAPDAGGLDSGATTQVDVIVENADSGVGAINASVTFSDPSVASVADVTIHGDPGLDSVTDRDDGVDISAALADTDDTGRVTIITLLVRGESPGETAIDVEMRALGDEDGTAYTVAETERPTLAVTDASDSNGGSSAPDDSEAGGSNPPESDSDGSSSDESTADGSAAGSTADGPSPGESAAGTASDAGDRTDGNDGVSNAVDNVAIDADDGPSSLYGPAGALGVIALGALAIYRFR